MPWAIPSSNGQAMYLDFQLVRVNEVQHGLHWSYDQSPEAPFGPRVDPPTPQSAASTAWVVALATGLQETCSQSLNYCNCSAHVYTYIHTYTTLHYTTLHYTTLQYNTYIHTYITYIYKQCIYIWICISIYIISSFICRYQKGNEDVTRISGDCPFVS